MPTLSPAWNSGAALAHDDRTGRNHFAAVGFHAQAFRFGVAAVAGTAARFYVPWCRSLTLNLTDQNLGVVLAMALALLVMRDGAS